MLNYASGEIEEMKANRVKRYIADDKNLSEEYKNEDDKEGQMLEYLRRYNRQHPLTK